MKKFKILSLLLLIAIGVCPEVMGQSKLKGLAKGFLKSVKENVVQQAEATSDAPAVLTYTPAQAIDLGLPSGTKWASYNVGASKPEEFGGYYAWGETEVKDNYTRETYQYTIKEAVLSLKDDVANVKWGGEWRMPTHEEANELLSKCDWENAEINGVKGKKVIGPNGNSIFLPEAGERDGAEHGCVGWMRYWTSTKYKYNEKSARMLSDTGCCDGHRGLTVRPVCK